MNVDKYLNSEIKDLLLKFPKMGVLLDEYNIYCSECSRGTCLLKDALEIHNLDEEDEKILVNKIAELIYPEIILPMLNAKGIVKNSKKTLCSPPIKKLLNDHKLIKRLLALIPAIIEYVANDKAEIMQLLLNCSDFVSSYIDQYHQVREEDNLFPVFDESLEILRIMSDEHEEIRFYAQILLTAITDNDKTAIKESLNMYRVVISEHIKKEENILYPWIGRSLTVAQIKELNSKYIELDINSPNITENYRDVIIKLETILAKAINKKTVHTIDN